MIPALIACFYAGIAAGWLLRGAFTPAPSSGATAAAAAPAPTAAGSSAGAPTTGVARATTSAVDLANPIHELRARHLRLPIDGANIEALKGNFDDTRDAGSRGHEAVDMLAPRNTPIHAVESGRIAKLFGSKAGGTTIYQFDPSGRFCYYYAHLERYADALHDGQQVLKGDVIGYVGTTGNAPANTPHLHFAIYQLPENRHWWEGTPLDPYLVFVP
jgi:murein DD-endopeptidase MepM/ murein hydrolase activator NlpD